MILCLGTTPAAQRVMLFRKLSIDAVNRASDTFDGAAGKSINVAKVLKALGERPLATGFLGGDRGEQLRALLAERGIEQEFLTVVPGTRQCITVIDQSAGTHTELVEESKPVSAGDYDKLLEVIRRRLRGAQALVMSGTLTPNGPTDFYAQCTRLACEAGVLSIVDAQGKPLLDALPAGPGLVKPNRTELAATVGHDLPDERAVLDAMAEIFKRGAARVVVTAGKDPTLAYDGQQFWRIHAPRIEAVNPIGSGDAFTAGLVWRLVRGENLGEACRWASAVGTANALTLMAGEVDPETVHRLAQEARVEQM